MKYSNVKYKGWAFFSNGTFLDKWFVTEQAYLNWANAQFRKDEKVVIEIIDFNTNELIEKIQA